MFNFISSPSKFIDFKPFFLFFFFFFFLVFFWLFHHAKLGKGVVLVILFKLICLYFDVVLVTLFSFVHHHKTDASLLKTLRSGFDRYKP
jgi:hypothetical protein